MFLEIYRTLSNIYDEAFLQKWLTTLIYSSVQIYVYIRNKS